MAKIVEQGVLSFPAAPQSAGEARRFVRGHLERWNLQADADDVVLMVSELVTNVGLHARTEATVHVWVSGDRLRVEVADGSTEPVEVQPHRSGAETGRGLMIVDKLAEDWGVAMGPAGKTVWFEVPARIGGADRGSAAASGGSTPA